MFGFGKNTNGQLGCGDEQSRFYPTQLKTLRSIGVRHISAGDDFSVFLTMDGGVFTCGAGKLNLFALFVTTKCALDSANE